MKILLLNWRDPKNPLEGGAERFTQRYAEFWASKGHEVTWLTNAYPGLSRDQVINGVRYLRIGPFLDGTLFRYFFFYPFYLLHTMCIAFFLIRKERVDLVIDEIHGFPFFTPLFSRARNVLLVCEVAGPIWEKMFPFPISWVGNLIEKSLYHLYQSTEIWAISPHTKRSILEILPHKRVRVIGLGVDLDDRTVQKVRKIKKTIYPSAIFLARLVKMKGIETALLATAEIARTEPNFRLEVAGSGDPQYVEHLHEMVKELHIEDNVIFLGKVSEEEKFAALKRAHFLFHFSYKEGFGLTVLEAGQVGTPTLARSGSGLEDLVAHSGVMFTLEEEIPQLFLQSLKPRIYERVVAQSRKLSEERAWNTLLPAFSLHRSKDKSV